MAPEDRGGLFGLSREKTLEVLLLILGGIIAALITVIGQRDDGSSSSSPSPSVTTVFVTSASQPTDDSSTPISTSTESTSTNPPANPEPVRKYLSELIAPSSADYELGAQKVDGKTYAHSVGLLDFGSQSSHPRTIDFQLDREWRTLHAFTGISNDLGADLRIQLEVFNADTGARLSSYIVKPNMMRELKLNVSGIARLTLSESWVEGAERYSTTGIAVWGDAEVRK